MGPEPENTERKVSYDCPKTDKTIEVTPSRVPPADLFGGNILYEIMVVGNHLPHDDFIQAVRNATSYESFAHDIERLFVDKTQLTAWRNQPPRKFVVALNQLRKLLGLPPVE